MVDVHLVDGTYELFRYFYVPPSHRNKNGEEVGAVRGVLNSVAGMLESGTTHIGVATDHVIESFRNKLWPDYKNSEGVDPNILAQFPLLEEGLAAMGVTVWPMIELEADDALAGAALSLSTFQEVARIIICSPDKDLAQCVRDDRVVQLDRRTQKIRNETGVKERFGVEPGSIPDWLALVGDSADGYPGLAGWGERSASVILGYYGHLEAIPPMVEDWQVNIRGAVRLAKTLRENFKLALRFRDLATLRTKEPQIASLEQIRWRGPDPRFTSLCSRLDDNQLFDRIAKLAQDFAMVGPRELFTAAQTANRK